MDDGSSTGAQGRSRLRPSRRFRPAGESQNCISLRFGPLRRASESGHTPERRNPDGSSQRNG